MGISARLLNEDLKRLDDYCKKWKLQINSSKTKVTVFGHYKADLKKYKFLCDGQELEAVDSFKVVAPSKIK